jgi:catechol 2,3-dioxygenase-like lactoylglutathione lyase family enzyme
MNAFRSAITFLRTSDLETTSAFYERVLGCPLILDQGGCKIYETSVNGSYLGFCSSVTPIKQPEAVCLTFVVPTIDDVDAWFQVLRRNHVTIDKAPTHNATYNIYHVFATDPNGYTVELQAFLHPFPPEPTRS